MKMQQPHINSFFKRKETSATSEIQSITISTNNVNNDDANNDSEQKTKTVNSVNSSDFVDVNNVGKNYFVQFRPDKWLKFPKTTIGNRDRRCQHQWFEDFNWLHYDMERDCVLCFYCFTHEHQLTAQHKKEPAYISTGFRNWKKAPRCFKEHEQSKCHTAALSYKTIIPKCGDPKEIISDEIVNKREKERQYLTMFIVFYCSSS